MEKRTRRSFVTGCGISLVFLSGCTEKAPSTVTLNIKEVSGVATERGWVLGVEVEYVAEHITPDNAGLLDVHLELYDKRKNHIQSESLGQYRPQRLPESSWEKRSNGGDIGGWGDGDDHFIHYTEQTTVTVLESPQWISFSYELSEEMYSVDRITTAQYIGPEEPTGEITPDDWNHAEIRHTIDNPPEPETPILPE
jgi:hypothetical protein